MRKHLFFFAFFIQISILSAQALYFPPLTGTTWQTLTPASQHFCQERIDSLYQFLDDHHTKAFILLKDGKIVLEKYFGNFVQDSIWYWASAGKSLTAFLVGQAQEQNLLHINDKTSDYLGLGWTSAPPDKEALITVRNQLSMTSGLDDLVPATPTNPDPNNCTDPQCLVYLADAGTRWAYHTGAYRLLHNVLAQASGMTIQQYTKNQVLDPAGMKGLWFQDVFYSRARDMARFGLLMQAHGVWNGDTLLHDQAYYHDMIHSSQQLNKSYGYLWWLNGQQSFMLPTLQFVFPGPLIPNAPADMYAALGKNDQKIHVAPSKGWVVIRMGDAAGYTNIGGENVPILFDNAMWGYLNQLDCSAVATAEPVDNQIIISPNPSSDAWTVQTSQPIQSASLYNTDGQLLQTFQTNGQQLQIPNRQLQAGMYTLRIQTQNGVTSQKLIKQ